MISAPGSGALLLAALDQWPDASGLGIDRSEAALRPGSRNAARLGMAERAEFRLGDWAEGIAERFDLILCNPPYVADGRRAWAGRRRPTNRPRPCSPARTGSTNCRASLPSIGGLLAPGGLAAIEIGFDQGESAASLFEVAGPQPVHRS